jgi:uncharacterized protein YbbK (DUF523 family)
MQTPIRIAISSCLLGESVRYDGGHKRDQSVIDAFGTLVEWVPVCPEVEMGLSIPREPIQVVKADAGPLRLIGAETGSDYAGRMREYATPKLDALAALGLCGYIFKSRSPSCGLRDVPVFDREGRLRQTGRGMFAAAITERFPDLPVADEARLSDATARDEFLQRVLAYARR